MIVVIVLFIQNVINHVLVDIRTNSTDRQLIPVESLYDMLRYRNVYQNDSDDSENSECPYKRGKWEKRIKMLNTCCGTITFIVISTVIIVYMSWILTGMINIA